MMIACMLFPYALEAIDQNAIRLWSGYLRN